MIEVIIDSIRVSLISQQRIVMLREAEGDSQLPIWIGPCEADAISIELQETELARPLTHDLLRKVIEEMGGKLDHIVINELRESVFHAQLVVQMGNTREDIDCRPSDAIALAVRAKVPIYVDESVMSEAGITPEPDIVEIDSAESTEADPELDQGLDAFRDFLDNLDD